MHRLFGIITCGVLLYAGMSFPAYAARSLEPFSWWAKESPNLAPFPKWTGTLSRYFDQKKLRQYQCGSVRFNPCALQSWEAYVSRLKGLTPLEQARSVNAYLNRIRYVTDPVNWRLPDYWSTPNEFLDIAGDCEDYAISKYMSLRALGFPVKSMRILIVQDMNLGGIIHSILAVKIDGEAYILDNQIRTLELASSIYHYKAIYSINEEAWWQY